MLRSYLPHPEFDPPKSDPLNSGITFPGVRGQLAQGSSKCKEQHFSAGGLKTSQTHLTDSLHEEPSAQLSNLKLMMVTDSCSDGHTYTFETNSADPFKQFFSTFALS